MGEQHRQLVGVGLLLLQRQPLEPSWRAATSGAARALRAGDIGAIEPGRAADLLVVDGKPHEDIRAVRNVVSVLRDGRFVVDRRPGG